MSTLSVVTHLPTNESQHDHPPPDLGGLYLQCRIQRERAVTVIVEAVAFCPARRQRQHRIQTVQGLNRSFFIDAEYRRMLRRIQVQTNDVRCFAFEVGIVADHIVFQTMGFQPRLGKNALDRGFVQAQLTRQLPARPMGAPVARFLWHPSRHSRLHRRGRNTRLATLMTSLRPSDLVQSGFANA